MIVCAEDSNPTGFPITLPEVKEHLKVKYDDEDELLNILIGAATEYAEKHTRRALMSRNFLFYLDNFPNKDTIEIPKSALTSVIYVKYYDTDDSLQTFSTDNYYTDLVSEPGRIKLQTGEIWPVTESSRPNAITISFTAGYASASAVPDSIKTAMFFMIGHWFENREAVVVGPTGLRVNEVPLSAKLLLDQNRVMSFY